MDWLLSKEICSLHSDSCKVRLDDVAVSSSSPQLTLLPRAALPRRPASPLHMTHSRSRRRYTESRVVPMTASRPSHECTAIVDFHVVNADIGYIPKIACRQMAMDHDLGHETGKVQKTTGRPAHATRGGVKPQASFWLQHIRCNAPGTQFAHVANIL
nr:hypothetical protein CFP56_50437 [Quercus suber]